MAYRIVYAIVTMKTISDNKIKVLMVGPDPSANGGIASVAKNYLGSSLTDLCDLRYVVTMKEGSKLNKLALALSSYVNYSRVVKKYDLVHLHLATGMSFTRKYYLAKCANNKGIPYLVHLHSGKFVSFYEGAKPWKRQRIRELFEHANAVIVLSERERDYFGEKICPDQNIIVLPNAVSIPEKRSDIKSNKILFLGRLDSNKSPDLLLYAGAELVKKKCNFTLVFAGDGNISMYESLARDLGISQQCEFLGWISKSKEKLLYSCDIFCLPSRAEGMPMSLLEAMAYGMAVITTPVGGIPRVIAHGENGLLVPVGNVDSLASSIMTLLMNPQMREELGDAARKTIEQHFGIQNHVQSLLAVYRSVLNDQRNNNFLYEK